MDVIQYLNLGVSILILLVGFLVLVYGKNKRIGLIFLFFCFSIAFWAGSIIAFSFYPNLIVVFRLSFLFAALLAVFIFLFSFYFPDENPPGFVNNWFYALIFLAWVIISFLSLSSFVIVGAEIGKNGGITGETGGGYLVYGIFLITLLAWSIINYIKKFVTSKGLQRLQIGYFFIGSIIFITLAVTSSLILPQFGIYEYNQLGPAFSLFVVGFTAYSIIAHRLFDIRVIIKKTLIYSVLLAFVLGLYSLVIFAFAQGLGTGQELTIKGMLPNLVATILIVIGFEPLRKWLTKVTDKYLFVGEYQPQVVLNKMSKLLSSVLDLDEALEQIINLLSSQMRLERAAAFVLTHDPEKDETMVKRAKHVGYEKEDIKLENKDGLIVYFEDYIRANHVLSRKGFKEERIPHEKKTKLIKPEEEKIEATPVLLDELEQLLNSSRDEKARNLLSNTIEEFKRLKGSVAIPVIVKNHLVGIFVLGGKKSGDIFNDTDLNLLNVIANQTAAAIEKARFYEEDQLKSEFVSIASHELLTPTSAIEGYLSMILEENMGKVDDKARGYLEKVYESSKRLAHLVKDLLNVSRIEGGRIVIQSKNFDLKKLIETVAEEVMPKAKEKNLELKVEGIDRDLPEVWADEDRVHQVLVNLVGNSIKYTDKGTVTIRADFSTSVVRVSVIDTGVGIPKDEVPHLFEKFYRASNADNNGAQGTGLGLYISKNMIELMGGIMQVDSEVGKGSVFSFSLPKGKSK